MGAIGMGAASTARPDGYTVGRITFQLSTFQSMGLAKPPGTLTIHGLQPDPMLFKNHLDVVYPILIALILGRMAEQNLRRSLILSHRDPIVFFTRPISAAFILLAVAVIISSYFRIKKTAQREQQNLAGGDKPRRYTRSSC